MTVKLCQKCLQGLCHGRVLDLHSIGIDNGQRNTINRRKKGDLDAVYKRGHRSCHSLIIGGLKIFKSPHQSHKGSQDTKACKNIRHHFQKSFMYVIIQFLFIKIFFNIINALFTFQNTVCKGIHCSVKIRMMKNAIQCFYLICSDPSRFAEKVSQLCGCILKRLSKMVHPEHASEHSHNINCHHNAKKDKIINHNADRALSHIQGHGYRGCQYRKKQNNIYNFFPHSKPPHWLLS